MAEDGHFIKKRGLGAHDSGGWKDQTAWCCITTWQRSRKKNDCIKGGTCLRKQESEEVPGLLFYNDLL